MDKVQHGKDLKLAGIDRCQNNKVALMLKSVYMIIRLQVCICLHLPAKHNIQVFFLF